MVVVPASMIGNIENTQNNDELCTAIVIKLSFVFNGSSRKIVARFEMNVRTKVDVSETETMNE